MKAPILHIDEIGELHLRQLTISECAEVADLIWQREHIEIQKRLKEAESTSSEKLEALSRHDDLRGLASELTRQCFRMNNAITVLQKAADPADASRINNLAPDEVINLAIRTLGYKEEAEDEKKESTLTTE
mgnify:CR=1 FL=1